MTTYHLLAISTHQQIAKLLVCADIYKLKPRTLLSIITPRCLWLMRQNDVETPDVPESPYANESRTHIRLKLEVVPQWQKITAMSIKCSNLPNCIKNKYANHYFKTFPSDIPCVDMHVYIEQQKIFSAFIILHLFLRFRECMMHVCM